MKISIFVHGVPDGQKVWSRDGDDAIVTNYYGQGQNEDVKFLAEVRKNGNSTFAYYTYLKYNNVTAYNGRSGAYVGLTIRMDSLCTEVMNIYHVLDIVYGKNVVGKIVAEEGYKTKFITPELNESNCKAIEQAIVNLLQNAISGRSFVMLTDQMAKGTSTTKLNVLDCDKQSILNLLAQGTNVAISPQYDTAKEGMQTAKLQRTISELQAQNSKLKADLNDCNMRLNRMEESNRRMQRETEQMQERMRKNLQYETPSITDETSDSKELLSSKIFPFLCTLIIIAAIGASWYLQKTQTDALAQNCRNIEIKLDSLAKEVADLAPKDTIKIDSSIVLDEVTDSLPESSTILTSNE